MRGLRAGANTDRLALCSRDMPQFEIRSGTRPLRGVTIRRRSSCMYLPPELSCRLRQSGRASPISLRPNAVISRDRSHQRSPISGINDSAKKIGPPRW